MRSRTLGSRSERSTGATRRSWRRRISRARSISIATAGVSVSARDRDIEIPFTVTGPLGVRSSNGARRCDRRFGRCPRCAGRTLAVLSRARGVRLRARSQRAAADREPEPSQCVHVDAREQLPRSRPLCRVERDFGRVAELAVRERSFGYRRLEVRDDRSGRPVSDRLASRSRGQPRERAVRALRVGYYGGLLFLSTAADARSPL